MNFVPARLAAFFRVTLWRVVKWMFPNAYLLAPTVVPTGNVVLIRHASVYVDGTKLGVMRWNRYTIGKHALATFLEVDTIVPSDGRGDELLQALLGADPVDISLSNIAGKTHTIRMGVEEAVFDSDVRTGTLDGRFKLSGGSPKVSE